MRRTGRSSPSTSMTLSLLWLTVGLPAFSLSLRPTLLTWCSCRGPREVQARRCPDLPRLVHCNCPLPFYLEITLGMGKANSYDSTTRSPAAMASSLSSATLGKTPTLSSRRSRRATNSGRSSSRAQLIPTRSTITRPPRSLSTASSRDVTRPRSLISRRRTPRSPLLRFPTSTRSGITLTRTSS